jgi:hypothetical protein
MLLVLVPPSTEDIDEKVAELIEPYSKWIKLPHKEYLRQWEIDQVRWRHHLPGDALEQIVGKIKEAGDEEVRLDEKGIYSITTHNPRGRWDGWRIGGVWDGYIQGKKRSDGKVGHNLGREHEQLHNNICLVSRLPRFFTVYELITPDCAGKRLECVYPEDIENALPTNSLIKEELLLQGKLVAVVMNVGTPGVSDPGLRWCAGLSG